MAQELSTSRRRFMQCSGAALLSMTRAGRLRAAEPANVPIVTEAIRQLAIEAPLSMRFRGSTDEECRRWQAQFTDKLRSLLGPHAPPTAWETVTEDVSDLKDHQRRQLLLVARGVPVLPIYLLLPKGKPAANRPGVVALHGHGRYGYEPVVGREDLPGVADDVESFRYDFGRQLVRRGYVVAAPCLMPFGRRLGDRDAYGGQDPCGDTFVRMQLLGKLLMAEVLRDCLWAVEFLARRPEVDPRRLGCVGLSYGGRMTMLTTALEPRIRVAVISGALNVMQERVMQHYSCGAQVIPGLLKYGDTPEIASLIAPRHCLWEIGSRDGLIKPEWRDKALERVGRAYRALGAEDRLTVDRFEGGHQWSGRLAYPLLEEVLRPPG